MNGLGLWLGLLGGELLLIVLVLLFTYWVRGMAAARRDNAAIKAMLENAKGNRNDREAEIGAYLKAAFGLQGEEAEAPRKAILREEFRLLQRLGLIYKRRDASAASKYPRFVETALEPYYELTGGSAAATGQDEAAGEVDDSELKQLREENKRLSDELSITMDTMSRMLSEYSTMFSGGGAEVAGVDAAAAVMPDDVEESSAAGVDPEDPPAEGAQAPADEDLPLRDTGLEADELDIGDTDITQDEEPASEIQADDDFDFGTLDDGEPILATESLDEADQSAGEALPGEAADETPEEEILELDDTIEDEARHVEEDAPDAAEVDATEVDDILAEMGVDAADADAADVSRQAAEPEKPAADVEDVTDLDDLFDGFEEDAEETKEKKGGDDAIAI